MTPDYVLVTPVRNEEATIGTTIESVVRQTILPSKWVVVSDESTDRTDEIVRGFADRYSFIELVRLSGRPKRSFSSVVFVIEAGIETLRNEKYEFFGVLDGDVRLGEAYYERILAEFSADKNLGIAGGLVVDYDRAGTMMKVQSLRDVAGAVQFFRRDCFDCLGGLVTLPEGGWDAITCLQARMHGFRTQTFSDIVVDHLKPRSAAQGNLPRRFFKLGVRDYDLGHHPLFEMIKCTYRTMERPYIIGGSIRLTGYAWCCIARRESFLPPDLVQQTRREQMARMFPFWGGV